LVGRGAHVAENNLTLRHNSRSFFASSCGDDFRPQDITQFKLLGKTLTFEVDLSRVGCACNLALYLVSAPALDTHGKPIKGAGDYYCDANKVGGQWCPEVDIMEANNHAFQATPHKCDPPVDGHHYVACDRSGCAQNTKDMDHAFGPGSDFTIDTKHSFNVSTTFLAKYGTLASMTTTLRQGNRKVVLDHANCQASYLSQLSDAMATGMSVVTSYWGGEAKTMSWMDMPPCGSQSCGGSNAGDGVISGIAVMDAFSHESESPVESAPRPEPVTSSLAVGGVDGRLYVAGHGGKVVNDRLSLWHNARTFMVSSDRTGLDPHDITQFRLLGKTFTFEVDLSSVGCACNLALYLVSAPALDMDGKPIRGAGEYYCDANKVDGQWCPEVDIMEANNHAFQATPHKCDAPVNGHHYTACDRGGCAQNTKDIANAYGPGSSFTIDTRHPFNVSTAFLERSQTLVGMITTLRQGGRSVVLDHANCQASYLAQLSNAMSAGMSLIMSYWGDAASTMSWMDMPPCGQQSCSAGHVGQGVISGIAVQNFVSKAEQVHSSLPATTLKPSSLHDCNIDLATWEDWHDAKKHWCCQNKYLGCPQDKAVTGVTTHQVVGLIRWVNHVDMCIASSSLTPSSGTNVVILACQLDDARQIFHRDAAGDIHFGAHPNMCISILADEARNGVSIQLRTCTRTGGNQQFNFPSKDMKIRWTNSPHMCLDVTNHRTEAWTPLQLWECLGDDSDQVFAWQLAPLPVPLEEHHALSTVAPTAGPSTERYNCFAQLATWETSWHPGQQTWCCREKYLGCANDKTGSSSTDAHIVGPIRWSNHADKCLTVPSTYADQKSNIVLSACKGVHDDAKQIFRKEGDGRIHWGADPDLCLSVHDNLRPDGMPIQLKACVSDGDAQQFDFPSHDMKIHWTSHPELCVNVQDHTTANENPIAFGRCMDDDTNQVFSWQRAAAEPPTGLSLPSGAAREREFDCEASFSDWRTSWTLRKRAWCCRHYGRGCSPTAAPSTQVTFGPPTTTPGPTTTTTLYFDCVMGFAQWEVGWSEQKKRWCCEAEKRGCPSTTHEDHYDCTIWFPGSEEHWKPEHRAWCCEFRGNGCTRAWHAESLPKPATKMDSAPAAKPETLGDVSDRTYDCNFGYEHWEQLWSQGQMAWCCHRMGRGCVKPTPAPTSSGLGSWNPAPAPASGGLGSWNPAPAPASGLGKWDAAPDSSSASVSMLHTTSPPVTPPKHDCLSGYAQRDEAWSAEKRHWCCQHRGLGCAPRHWSPWHSASSGKFQEMGLVSASSAGGSPAYVLAVAIAAGAVGGVGAVALIVRRGWSLIDDAVSQEAEVGAAPGQEVRLLVGDDAFRT